MLAEQGQCLPFEPPHFAKTPADAATVGGMVAAGLSGPARASVGAVRDYLLGVTLLNGKAELQIELKYYEGASVIREIGRVSKPGRRVYVSVKSIPQVANGLGITILSTPKGVMADHQAREQNVGGEILCSVF